MRKAKTTTTVVSLIAAALLALLITAMLTGCSEADKVKANNPRKRGGAGARLHPAMASLDGEGTA